MGGATSQRGRSLKARAIQLLSQREHSRLELKQKLLPHALAQEQAPQPEQPPPISLEELLDWLEANQYLSQERFVESRIHARASRFGNLRIRQELNQHAVALSEQAESTLKDTELARAFGVWTRKFGSPAASPADLARQSRFLAGRGFSGDVIRQVLRKAAKAAASEGSEVEVDSSEPD